MLIGLITASRHRERLPFLEEADIQLEAPDTGEIIPPPRLPAA